MTAELAQQAAQADPTSVLQEAQTVGQHAKDLPTPHLQRVKQVQAATLTAAVLQQAVLAVPVLAATAATAASHLAVTAELAV